MTQSETLLRHKELLLLGTFVSESAAEVEGSLDELREDSNDPDWQYLKGQLDTLRTVARKIRDMVAADDKQYDRFRLTPAGELIQAQEEAA